MTTYPINNKEDAISFAERLVKFAGKKTFKPLKLETDWGKIRSNPQSRWYFRSISKYLLPYYIANPGKLAALIRKALGNGLNIRFIHECLKLIYLQGGSTTRINTERMAKMMKDLRHDVYHDYGIDIPEPKEKL